MRLTRTSEHEPPLAALPFVLAYAATSTSPAYLTYLPASTRNAPAGLSRVLT